ncbi:MAG: hypothetical protein GVY19_05670 [Bacteroidetes bacterium]|jgi:antitoxin component YwqK of YwqJK toxin-antitoxin module|nr:hypothetical protein [Bacteroidota bacterium]
MKKLLLYIVMGSIIGLSSCGKRKITITETELTNDIFYYNGSIYPFSGVCEILYEKSDQAKIIMHFKEGKLNGHVKTFYKNGDVKVKGHYEDGLMSGKWEGWYESGKKAYEVHYKEDSLHGKYTSYQENGALKAKGEYKMNTKFGEWEHFKASGHLITNAKLLACYQ